MIKCQMNKSERSLINANHIQGLGFIALFKLKVPLSRGYLHERTFSVVTGRGSWGLNI